MFKEMRIIDNHIYGTFCFQQVTKEVPKTSTTTRPEIPEDYVRNFLVRMGMLATLDTFQTEW